MADVDIQKIMEGMRATLEQDEQAGKLAGLTVADLEDAMSHPKAAAVIAETFAAEQGSVRQGEDAPDFTLPWLPASEKPGTDALSLSSHFGTRPVALIFGSYT
jgi:hypothetical protein